MAVGTTPRECYQGEDVDWPWEHSDPTEGDITGWTIELVIKETAASPDPPLIGPVTCVVTDATHYHAPFKVDLDPGEYVHSVRRVDTGRNWQMVHARLTVLDSASVDATP